MKMKNKFYLILYFLTIKLNEIQDKKYLSSFPIKNAKQI